MDQAPKCPECGAEVSPEAPLGICQACLLKMASQPNEPLPTSDRSPKSTISLSLPLTEKPGDRIGHYKLLEQLGEGGCGVVYVAEQQQPVRRRVALKVIKLGMDTRQVVARFEAERQALALMDHPNIAKVFDAGATDTGRPYFVMELVKGIPVTRYCDENKLDTKERLNLFIQICQAIQHAHQKGVIHRDIKPQNILVADHDGVPVPKVIDFGIAKATTDQPLTDKTLYTAIEQFIGTPAYMSPEQARLSGLDIDTRSDIYSLGVLLYELLTGKTPFDSKRLIEAGLDEIRRIIREEDPPRPSTKLSTLEAKEQTEVATRRHSEPPRLLGLIRGDLDWIAMKCLEKDRNRRYETANGLALDLGRFLRNEPVAARPPGNLYRLRKLVRRNRLAFTAGAAIGISLIAGLAETGLWLSERALNAEKEKRRQAEIARMETGLRQKTQAAQATANASVLLATEATQRASQADLVHSVMGPSQEASEQGRAANDGGTSPHDSGSDALAFLVRSLKAAPTNAAAVMRLWSLLTYDSWSIPINSVQLSGDIQLMPDGKSILLASGTTARLLDMEIGPDSTDRFFPHGGMVRSALASPDGTRILTASDDRSAMVWDAKIARKLVELRHQGAVRFAQFSRDMQRIVTASDDRTARVWDAGTGQSLAILQHTGAVRTAQFSFDGDRIVTASELGDGQIACVWEIETGRLVAETAKASAVMAQFSRDGEKILTTGWAGETRVWEANTGRELTNGFRFFGVGTASQRTDAGLMIHAAWKNGRVLDAETQQPLTPPFKHSTRVVSAEISADGRRAITRDADQWTHLWDVQGGGARPLFLKHPGSLAIAKFSPNSQRVVTCGGNALRCWSAQSGEVLMSASIQDLKPSEARFSPDGNWIAVASENLVFILNAQTGQLRTAPLKHDGKVVSVEFSAKGSLILTASEDKTARLWDAKSGSGVGEPFVHGAALRGAKFDLQSKRIFTFDGDGETRIWETSDGLRFSSRGSFKGGEPTGFSPDSKRIVTKDGWATRQWDALTGREIGKALLHPAWVNSAQFSPDGHQLLTGSFSGGVRIWDAGSGEPLTEPIHGGDGAIGRFSPDGRLVAAVSWTQPVRVYDAHTGLPVADSLWGADPEFSSNGNWLLTRDGENAWVWEMPPAQSNCPEWVLNLAEAISGQSLSSSGVLVTTALERERAATVQAIRRKLEDERGADDWTLWGRWFLADRGARTISPLSKTTTADYVFRRIQENSAASLLDAERLAAGNSNLLVEVHEARSVAELLKRAQSLRSQNLFEEAERLCRQALAIGLHFWTNQPSALESTVHDLADLLQEQHQESETEELFDDVLSQVTPDHPHRAILIRWRAEFLARHGRWKEATEALLQAIRLEPGDYWRRCIAATLLAHDGVVEKHFTHCHELLTRFRSVGEPWQQHDLGRALALLPASGDDLALASELSGKALASDKTSWLYPWYQLTRAMTEYREGHFTNATQWVEQSLAKAGEDKRFRAQAFSIKAMAQYALNQPQEARSALEIAERALAQELRVRDRGDLRPDWFDLLNAHTLVTEALWLIGGTTNGWATLSQFKSAKNAELSQWLLGWRPRLEEGSRVRRLVTSRTWSFSRGDGSMLAPNISLSEDGKILGYNNVNEARWALENGAVVFYNNRDEPSCRFTNFVQEAGKIRLSGAFLLGGTGSHVLKEGRLHLANRADTLRNEGKWDEAEATYREGLALNRESWTNYLPAIEGNIGDLVRFLLEEGKSAEAERVLSEAMGPQTDGRHEIGDLLRLRGECEARQAHWKQAAADFGQALQLSTSNYWVWRQLAPLLVQTHELDQYRSEGEAMLARFAGTTNVDAARAISLACLLFSPSQASLAEASKMADLAVATNNPSRTGQETFTDRLQTLLSQANQSTSFGTKALAEYRAGHFAEAADWMERGLSQAEADRSVFTPGGSSFYERLRNVIQRSPTLAGGDNGGADQACFVLAMARHQLKQPAEARAALARGIGILQTNLLRVDTADLGPEWSRVLVSQILLREAKTLIEGTDPAQIAAAQTIELTDALAAARTRFERMKPIRLLRLQEAALVVQRKPKDGEALYREALALHRRMVGNDDPDLAGSIRDLARTLADQGKLGEAETLYREKLSLFRRDPTNNTVQFRDSLLDLAGVLHRETNYSGIEQLFSDALPLADEAQPQFADLLSWQADIRSQYGHFKESAAEYAKLIEVASTNTWTHLNYCKRAALLIQTGDLAAYQKLRQEILDRFGSVTNANYAESIAKAVLLLPLEGDLLSQATQLAKRRAGMPGLPSSAMATGTVPTQPIPLSSSSSQTNANATSPTTPSSPPRTLPPRTFRTPVIALPVVPALAAYRQSQFMDATNYLQQLFTATNQSANPTLEAQAHFIVAMSLHRLGESRQAQTLLSKGAGILVAKTPALESTSVGPGWYELLIAHALLREAKALIEATEKTDGPRAEKPEGVASPDERKPASSQ